MCDHQCVKICKVIIETLSTWKSMNNGTLRARVLLHTSQDRCDCSCSSVFSIVSLFQLITSVAWCRGISHGKSASRGVKCQIAGVCARVISSRSRCRSNSLSSLIAYIVVPSPICVSLYARISFIDRNDDQCCLCHLSTRFSSPSHSFAIHSRHVSKLPLSRRVRILCAYRVSRYYRLVYRLKGQIS